MFACAWPERLDTREALLRATRDADPDIKSWAIEMLALQWPDDAQATEALRQIHLDCDGVWPATKRWLAWRQETSR